MFLAVSIVLAVVCFLGSVMWYNTMGASKDNNITAVAFLLFLLSWVGAILGIIGIILAVHA